MTFRFLFLACGATCAAAPSAPLALDDAIRLAWANDPAVAALALTPELARAREEQAGIRPNPEVEFRGATRSIEIIEGVLPGDRVVTRGNYQLQFVGGGAQKIEDDHGHSHGPGGHQH